MHSGTPAAWEKLEDDTATALGGKRLARDWAAFESAPDVEVPDFRLVCDCKAHQHFRHHTLLETCRRKYCGISQVPALVTRRPGGRASITVPLDFLAGLLDEVRAARFAARSEDRVAPYAAKTADRGSVRMQDTAACDARKQRC